MTQLNNLMDRRLFTTSFARIALLLASCAILYGHGSDFRKITDVRYAQAGDHALLLDLYLPNGVDQAPLLVYVHGGAWRNGSKDSMPLTGLVDQGFAVASVDYRLSPIARFPAQIHDIKAAIRFLRAKQGEYGYDSSAITITGSSAGGAFGCARRRHEWPQGVGRGSRRPP